MQCICKKQVPDIVVMDIGLPGLNGIEDATEILRHQSAAKVLVFSVFDDEHSVVGAIRSAPALSCRKELSDKDLVDALRTVAKGRLLPQPASSDRLLRRIQGGDLEPDKAPSILGQRPFAATSKP